MPAFTALDAGVDQDGGSSATTASVSVATGELAHCTAGQIEADFSTPELCSISSWTSVRTDVVFVDAFGINERLTLFRRAGSFSGTQTISVSVNQNTITWIMSKVDDVETGGTNGSNGVVQYGFANSTGPSISLTLSALANANHYVFGQALTFDPTAVVSEDSGDGWTLLHALNFGGLDAAIGTYKAGDNVVTANHSTSGEWGIYGWELNTLDKAATLGMTLKKATMALAAGQKDLATLGIETEKVTMDLNAVMLPTGTLNTVTTPVEISMSAYQSQLVTLGMAVKKVEMALEAIQAILGTLGVNLAKATIEISAVMQPDGTVVMTIEPVGMDINAAQSYLATLASEIANVTMDLNAVHGEPTTVTLGMSLAAAEMALNAVMVPTGTLEITLTPAEMSLAADQSHLATLGIEITPVEISLAALQSHLATLGLEIQNVAMAIAAGQIIYGTLQVDLPSIVASLNAYERPDVTIGMTTAAVEILLRATSGRPEFSTEGGSGHILVIRSRFIRPVGNGPAGVLPTRHRIVRPVIE